MADDGMDTERQLVIFDLGSESFGVDIATVREIIQMQQVTTVPGARHSVEGVINLRGSVIPVVDLRKRFGLEEVERDKDTRIMVINSTGQDIGMIVDSVTEVLRIQSNAIEPPSAIIASSDSDYLLGIVKLPDKLIILLDADRVLTGDNEVSIETLTSQLNRTSGEADAAEVVSRKA